MHNNLIQPAVIRHVSVAQEIGWEVLCEQAPELALIKEDAERILADIPQDRWFWGRYESLKRRMASCVGMFANAKESWMCSDQAYDLAYKEIFGRYV